MGPFVYTQGSTCDSAVAPAVACVEFTFTQGEAGRLPAQRPAPSKGAVAASKPTPDRVPCSMVLYNPLHTVSVQAPPAWRALQDVPAECLNAPGKLHGAPPCLRTLRKVGWGRDACWRLGTFDDLSNLALDVDFALDRNPDEPCCKLLFVNRTSEKRRRVGYMLLAAKEDASALRGMQISEDLRGRGLSRVLLAAWLRMCITASLQPTTGTINKPLLALTLDRFGFEPVIRRGRQVRVHAGTRRLTNCRGWQDERGETPLEGQYRTAFVRTPFEVARPDALEAAVDETLGDHFVLEADGEALRRALTLRGGWRSTGPLDLRFVMTRRRVASARPVQ